MPEAVVAALTAFGVVFFAELGDKTQFLSAGFASRYRMRTIAAGLIIGYGLAGLLAVLVGGLVGSALSGRPIEIASGVIFLGFAVASLRPVNAAPATDEPNSTSKLRWAVAAIAAAIFVGELGDKTQIATVSLAAQSNLVATWVGATLGATASGLVGAAAGRFLNGRIGERALRLAAGGLFAGFGIVLVLGLP